MNITTPNRNAPVSSETTNYPQIIQGGMGVGVSHWKLARAVAQTGQLGVVSGTALDTLFIRRLQQGDRDGSLRRALAAFPFPEVSQRLLKQYLGKAWSNDRQLFQLNPLPSHQSPSSWTELVVAAHFCEIFLAREGLEGNIGLNLMEKIQIPTLPSLFGAMMAGVDYVLMGAGIPVAIPETLDLLAKGKPVKLPLHVEGAQHGQEYHLSFDPSPWLGPIATPLKRPRFLAIVSTHTLAQALLRKANGKIDGFIVENHRAGGHNAPPRNRHLQNGEPCYGAKDEADLGKMREFGVPFWLAGHFTDHSAYLWAREQGAAGIQSGTPFAFCQDSGLANDFRIPALAQARAGTLQVVTDAHASPTGFPFKVVRLAGTMSEDEVHQSRKRRCDLGYLRKPAVGPDGKLVYRCPGEPVADYLRKGGKEEDTVGRKCLCNGLLGAIGIGQSFMTGWDEPAIITAGDCLEEWARQPVAQTDDYTAADVITHFLEG